MTYLQVKRYVLRHVKKHKCHVCGKIDVPDAQGGYFVYCIHLTSSPVRARSRRLRGNWTPGADQEVVLWNPDLDLVAQLENHGI